MTITVKFFSLIREAVDTEQLTLEMSDRLSTVEALKNELSLRGEIWKEALSHPNLIQAINQRVVFQEEGIKDGDEVAFFPPMTGGSDVTVTVGSEPIDEAAELKAFPRDAETGAVVSFTGTVRSSAEAPLETLTLEHYPGMTEKALADIASKAQARWPLTGLRIAHRVGPMRPTETIVLVIASSAHRDAAFEAARFVMDVLKTDAPFWKKETGSDGEKWVEARGSDADARKGWDG